MVDVTAINSARIEVKARDIGVHLSQLPTRWGDVNFTARATPQPAFTIRTTSLSDPIHEAESPRSAQGGRDRHISSRVAGLRVGWNLAFHSYLVSRDFQLIQVIRGAREVPHQIYHDAFVHYGLPGATLPLH